MPTPAAKEQRLIRLNATLKLVAQVRDHTRLLSHEARKAMFFRIRHDRPLRIEDLQSTGLTFMGSPGTDESLVVLKKDDAFDKLVSRLKQYADSDDSKVIQRSANLVEGTKDISLGKPEDRFSEAFAAKYSKLLKQKFCLVELEITSFATLKPSKLHELKSTVKDIKKTLGVSGNIYDVDYEERSAMIVIGCSGSTLRDLVEGATWQRRITVFDVRPSFKTLHETYRDFRIDRISIEAPPVDAETICIIDTGVSAGNPFLAKVIRRDLCKSYINGFEATVDEQGHGSGVASLAAYHAIDYTNGGINRARAWIASARITDDRGELDVLTKDDNGQYWVEGGKLLSKLLQDIVEDMVARGVRIFVFSFFLDRVWSQVSKKVTPRNLWLARTIDRLCQKHSIVFTTITGNILVGDIEELHRGTAYPQYFNAVPAKLCDPAQAALAVTVGSIAHSARVVTPTHGPIALVGAPSPFTRSGPGFCDCIKPDFVERGGNLVVDVETGSISSTYLSTNVVMASGQQSPALNHSWGTSFAAPRVAHHAAVIASDLRKIGIEPSAELIRSFLALSATLDSGMCVFDNPDADRTVLGYGLPDGGRATDCERHAITTFYQGSVEAGRVLLFGVHVPKELGNFGRGEKSITVCAATAPPVQQLGIEEYLGADLQFRLFRGDAPHEKVVAKMCDLAASDTTQQQRKDLSKVLAKFDIDGAPSLSTRSVGTLQKATFTWHDHKASFSEQDYLLACSLRPASWWKQSGRQLRFACVVRLEDRTARCTEVYARVQARIDIQVRTQQRL